MKNQKGVNLVSLSVAVIVIIAIAGTVLYNVRTNLGIQKLKAMQADIENLRGKVENYYLQYGALPTLNVYSGGIKQNTSIPKESNVIKDVVENAASKDLDTGDYYVIDLKAMENITLTYGKDYEKLKDKSAETINTLGNGTLTDVYIINAVSHNIFYVHGTTYEGKTYYTQYQDEEKGKEGKLNLNIDIDSKVGRDAEGNMVYYVDKGEKAPSNRKSIYKDNDDNQAVIPAGFTVSDVDGESTIENGLVVKDENDNEWVWIPVSSDDLQLMYEEDNVGWTMAGTNVVTKYKTKTTTLGSYDLGRVNPGVISEKDIYKEPDILAKENSYSEFFYDAGFADLSDLALKLRNDYKDMIDSIKKYNGFFIGRYELSGTVEQPLERKNKNVLSNVNWYNLYGACKRFSNQNVEARMIWGCQWDQVCRFISNFGQKVDLNVSTTYGNYKNSTGAADITGKGKRQNTGYSEYWKVNNIYDIAGNCWELTQEAYDYGGQCRARRGRFL